MTRVKAPPIPSAVLNESETANYTGMSTAFLRRCRMTTMNRSQSTGPDFFRVPGGKAIRYRVVDLDRWLADNVKKGAV